MRAKHGFPSFLHFLSRCYLYPIRCTGFLFLTKCTYIVVYGSSVVCKTLDRVCVSPGCPHDLCVSVYPFQLFTFDLCLCTIQINRSTLGPFHSRLLVPMTLFTLGRWSLIAIEECLMSNDDLITFTIYFLVSIVG